MKQAIKWRGLPTLEDMQKTFTPEYVEEIKDFLDTRAYNALTVNRRIMYCDLYDYIRYLEMQHKEDQKTIEKQNNIFLGVIMKNKEKQLDEVVCLTNGMFIGQAVEIDEVNDKKAYALVNGNNLFNNTFYAGNQVAQIFTTISESNAKGQYKIYAVKEATLELMSNIDKNGIEVYAMADKFATEIKPL